jgi:hypothetical protein
VTSRKRAWMIDGASALRFSSVGPFIVRQSKSVAPRRDQSALNLIASCVTILRSAPLVQPADCEKYVIEYCTIHTKLKFRIEELCERGSRATTVHVPMR